MGQLICRRDHLFRHRLALGQGSRDRGCRVQSMYQARLRRYHAPFLHRLQLLRLLHRTRHRHKLVPRHVPQRKRRSLGLRRLPRIVANLDFSQKKLLIS